MSDVEYKTLLASSIRQSDGFQNIYVCLRNVLYWLYRTVTNGAGMQCQYYWGTRMCSGLSWAAGVRFWNLLSSLSGCCCQSLTTYGAGLASTSYRSYNEISYEFLHYDLCRILFPFNILGNSLLFFAKTKSKKMRDAAQIIVSQQASWKVRELNWNKNMKQDIEML